jgi:hypothetical protein
VLFPHGKWQSHPQAPGVLFWGCPVSYEQLLRDPRWQKKRLQILERDGWKCRACFKESETLHVHHLAYRNGTNPWDYNERVLLTLCESCHDLAHRKTPGISADELNLLLSLRSKWIRDLQNENQEAYSVLLYYLRTFIEMPQYRPLLEELFMLANAGKEVNQLVDFAKKLSEEWWRVNGSR